MWYGVFFFKQKTAYEMRISDWSSDVCSSDLSGPHGGHRIRVGNGLVSLHLAGDLADLARVLWVGGVAGFLQLLDEAFRIAGIARHLNGGPITVVFFQQADEVVEALLERIVGAEARYLAGCLTVYVLGGIPGQSGVASGRERGLQ